MSLQLDDHYSSTLNDGCIVVAGPGTTTTIPGIIVSEIVKALSETSQVRRIEVDLGSHSTRGLHRAPSLAASYGVPQGTQRHRAPRNNRDRKKFFRQWIGSDVKLAVAYAWPGIDNEWIRDFLLVSKSAGIRTLVLCASLPRSHKSHADSLVSVLRGAERVVVGDAAEASELVATFGSSGPEVIIHRALSLIGRRPRTSPQRFSAFLPKDDTETLTSLLVAFDAIPDSRISRYRLRVISRYNKTTAKSVVDKSHHAPHVEFLGDDMSEDDLRQLCEASSAISMADPQFDSRAFSTAVSCGVATVVLASSKSPPSVGRGYVGGLMADVLRPASIHVAMRHALRLDELGFPSPDAWRDLARCLVKSENLANCSETTRVSKLIRTWQSSPKLVSPQISTETS